jgi:NADH-quinone oxidoreductase subunit A
MGSEAANHFFDFANVLLFLLAAVGFEIAALVAGSFLRRDRWNKEKMRIYECGEPAIGSSWIRYNIRFYRLALVFLVFEVEVVFLFPVAVVLKDLGLEMGWLVFVEVIVFVAVLAIALIYAWRFGSLEWITSPREGESGPAS